MTDNPKFLGRRSLLGHSILGGAALATNFIPEHALANSAVPSKGVEEAIAAGQIRRVVTGQKSDGKSFIVSDELVSITNLWQTTSKDPLGTGPAEGSAAITPGGGSRCFVARLPPSEHPMPSLENRSGFHRAGGSAYCLILTGEITFLVDQEEVNLSVGSLVVERNTDHSWRNEGIEPVAVLVMVVEGQAEI